MPQNNPRPGDPLTAGESKAIESVNTYRKQYPDATMAQACEATQTTYSVFFRARKKLGEITSKSGKPKQKYAKKASPMQTLLVQDVTKKNNVVAVIGDVESITQILKGWEN